MSANAFSGYGNSSDLPELIFKQFFTICVVTFVTLPLRNRF